MKNGVTAFAWTALLFAVPVFADEPAFVPTAEQLEFFERDVRPLLLASCGNCHGEKKQWAELRVDSRDRLLKGGDTGPAIVPGDPDNSLLIQAVRRTGDYEMPPDQPLTAEQVAVLEKWVQMGAPWPEDQKSALAREELHRTHWAFQPVSNPTPPVVEDTSWIKTPVDAFILHKLQEHELTSSPVADRHTLIRRVTYDLTGLPPTSAEMEAFVNDPDPAAYQNLVERLLASPRYAEHWARKWLDLARFADTKGYVYGREERRFVHSWVYRDWVIRAFQEDMPYDQFLLLQIAADQAAPEDLPSQAAMGFLTIGRRFLGNPHDIIDDRVDVLGRTTMGLTIGCARCHDHKYDPIPTADYYSLYGVFQNSADELAHVSTHPDQGATAPAFWEGLQEREQKFNQEFQAKREAAAARVRERIADYLFAQSELDKYPDVAFVQILAPEDIYPTFVYRWGSYLRKTRRLNNPVFVPWHLYFALPKETFAADAVAVTEQITAMGADQVHPLVKELFATSPQNLREVADRYGALFIQINTRWKEEVQKSADAQQPAPAGLSDPAEEQLRAMLYGDASPCSTPKNGMVGAEWYFDNDTTVALWGLSSDRDRWLIDQAAAPPMTLRMVDQEFLEEPQIFRRGNPATKGEEVPRQFPIVVAGPDRTPFQIGSGRLELAQGIIARDNPLTARVWVNRIWQHHFGTGIVPTPSDFGIRAAQPQHLELLDWLAQKLMNEGWSTKAIHRVILLSSAYQQQSTGPGDLAVRIRATETDPTNELIWKTNPHRLSFEEFRDSLLAISGELDMTPGGKAAPLLEGSTVNNRRSIYGYIDRQFLPTVYRIFDFANPDLHIPVRSETTVSQQALFAMNHPFIAGRAQHLNRELEKSEIPLTPEQRTMELFQRIYQRAPSPLETQAALNFLSSSESEPAIAPTPEQLAWTYGYGHITPESSQVDFFRPLPYFSGSAWQGSGTWPDASTGWAQLTAEGGHPGNDADHAVVRRWTAPRDVTLSISSKTTHEPAAGNGIRCWIISSRNGTLNQFTVFNSTQEIQLSGIVVKAGETLDFVVDVNGELNSDQYKWDVILSEASPLAGGGDQANWISSRDFTTPTITILTPWEQLTQVLLLSNEFLFVD